MVQPVLTSEEQEFLDELYRRYNVRLQLYSFALLDKRWEYWPLAEDCVQITFEKAMTKIVVLRKHDTPYLWLKKTCHNITISERRKYYNRAKILHYPVSLDEVEPVADPKNDIAEWIAREALLDKKQELIKALTEQEFIVYKETYEEGKTIQETARDLKVTDGAIRGALQRIRRKIIKLSTCILLGAWCIFHFWCN